MRKRTYLRVKEAADYLNVSIGTLRNWDASGKLKPVRSSGGQRCYPIDYLDKFKGSMKALDARNVISEIEKDKRIKELEEEVRRRDERLSNAAKIYRQQQKTIEELKNCGTDFCLSILIETKKEGYFLNQLYTTVAEVHNKERNDNVYIPVEYKDKCVLMVKIVCYILNHLDNADSKIIDFIKRYIYNNLKVTNLSIGSFWDDVLQTADMKIEEYETGKYHIVNYDKNEQTIVIAC